MTQTLKHTQRLALLLSSIFSLALPVTVAAAGPTLTFSPHCTASVAGGENPFGGPLPDSDVLITEGQHAQDCPTFEVKDPQFLQTGVLKEGDTLEIVPVIVNKDHASITGVHTWISYDPTALKGVSVTIDSSFPIPTPGESDFDETNGYVKIGASAQTPLDGGMLPIASIKFTVLKTTSASTILSYFEPGNAKESHTTIIGKSGTEEQSLLSSDPLAALVVKLDHAESATPSSVSEEQASSSAVAFPESSVSSAAIVAATSSEQSSAKQFPAAPETPPSAPPQQNDALFAALQVSNLRVTTQGSSAFLGWDKLPSSELIGYNIYYGATSGQYLQRKTIDKSETTLTIRDLPDGVTYFFAIRGVNAGGSETDFSKEVSVTIGNAKTSTAPLSASMIDNGPNGKAPSTGGKINGDTGAASTLLIIVATCALVGTFLALRRQMIAHTHLPHA